MQFIPVNKLRMKRLILLINLFHQLNCNSFRTQIDINFNNSIVRILKNVEPMNKQDEFWLQQLLNMIFNYSTLLVPILSIVFLVKNNFCFSKVQKLKFLQIFVYGKVKISNDVELEVQLLEKNLNKKNIFAAVEDNSIVWNANRFLILLYCVAGLQIFYLTWGLIQEKIMTTTYSTLKLDNSSRYELLRFNDSQFLVLINRVLAFAFSTIILVISNLRDRLTNKNYIAPKAKGKYLIAPLNELVYCSLSNILSSWCQYEALKYVNFPAQVLSKACKLLVVMFMSQVINNKRYKRIEYIFALSITFGMTFFLYGSQQLQDKYFQKLHQKSSDIYAHSFFDGIFLLILYVTFDAFTSNWQGKIFEKYGISSLQMMAVINFYSIVFTLISLTETGNLFKNLKLVLNCKELLRDCILLSVCSASGQLFVFDTISKFGPLIFTTIMTVRQALAILLSCLIYKHQLSALSIFGICLVFTTLFYQVYYKINTRLSHSKN